MWGKKDRSFFVDNMGSGIGNHPGFDLPGAWNIFLLCSTLPRELLLNNPIQYPDYTSILPACVGGSLQKVPGYDGATAGELAEKLSPPEFVQALSDFGMFVPRLFLGGQWETAVYARALELEGIGAAAAAALVPVAEEPQVTKVVNLDGFRKSKLRRVG